MLLRLDPEQDAIAVLSIPRDLKVEIPGYGTQKFNAAYTYGGAKLTLRVVKELTGPGDQPRRQRRLPRLRAGGGRDRMRVRRRRPPLLPQQRRILRRICRNQRPARLPAALREKGAAVRPLPAHRHRPRPLGPPAGLHQLGPRPGADRGTAARPQRTDRHLHEIHDIRHQRHRDDDPDARPLRRIAQRRDQGGPLPGRTRPELRLRLAERDPRRRRKVPRQRSERRAARLAGRAGKARRRRLQGQEEEDSIRW